MLAVVFLLLILLFAQSRYFQKREQFLISQALRSKDIAIISSARVLLSPELISKLEKERVSNEDVFVYVGYAEKSIGPIGKAEKLNSRIALQEFVDTDVPFGMQQVNSMRSLSHSDRAWINDRLSDLSLTISQKILYMDGARQWAPETFRAAYFDVYQTQP